MERRTLEMKYLFVAAVLIVLVGCSKVPVAQADLEKQFQQMLNGAAMIGYSTRTNKEGLSGEEKYTIEKVTKVSGETWLIHARIRYGTHDLPVPVPVTIKWAGDTPMITLTDLSLPGMGTYTARVLLYRDQYAGTWSGEKAGGQMFGKIVRGQ